MSEVEAAARGLLALDEEELTTKLGLLDQFVGSDPNATLIDYLDSLPEPKGGLDDLLSVCSSGGFAHTYFGQWWITSIPRSGCGNFAG